MLKLINKKNLWGWKVEKLKKRVLHGEKIAKIIASETQEKDELRMLHDTSFFFEIRNTHEIKTKKSN